MTELWLCLTLLSVRSNLSVVWLGGRFQGGSLVWLDGSPTDFTAWLPGQPDSRQPQDCLGLQANQWDDLDCREHLGTSCVCRKHFNGWQ